MEVLCLILLIVLSVLLIVLITLQPRQTQIFSNDAMSNIGKVSYWSSQPLLKIGTLVTSLALLVLLLFLMIFVYN